MNEPRIIKKGKYYHIVITHEGKQVNLKYLGDIYKILGMDKEQIAEKLTCSQTSIPKDDEINKLCDEVLNNKGSS